MNSPSLKVGDKVTFVDGPIDHPAKVTSMVVTQVVCGAVRPTFPLDDEMAESQSLSECVKNV